MYKLEFALPKFRMYRRVLAKVLAENFCIDRGWSEERAVTFGKQVLRGNVENGVRHALRSFPPSRARQEAAAHRAARFRTPSTSVTGRFLTGVRLDRW